MLICVTHRQLCKDDFLLRIRRLVEARPYALMLREKDLDALAYERLAIDVKEICERNEVKLILHHHVSVAEKLEHDCLQLSMPELQAYRKEVQHMTIGASVHSVSEAREAQILGAAYVIAGHIYATDCKQGLPPRGLSFLQQICQAVEIPVFAIGGINRSNMWQTLACGVKGICIMSETMTCLDPAEFVRSISLKQK
jgi:thiamine-phosphate pyrophosphorylase